jgi:hypothetical protein
VLAVAALALALAGPPPATVDGTRLAVSSWCWGTHCGAPISASTRTIRAGRGSTVRVELAFEPSRVQLAVAGVRVTPQGHGHEVSWHATRSGGITLKVTAARGWITYVARLVVT